MYKHFTTQFEFDMTDYTCNQFHNILRLFNVLPNFPLTTSEAVGEDYV